MSASEATSRTGVFDRTSKGKSTDPVQVEIERGRIIFFAETIGETNPIHHSRQAAKSQGYANIVAPPTYASVVEMLATQVLVRREKASIPQIINCDFQRALHGVERYFYTAPILAGEVVSVSTRVNDFENKKNGQMELAHLHTEITHTERGLLVAIERTLIHKL